MTEPMTDARLQEIRVALTQLMPHISNATDLLAEVDRLRTALNAPLLHAATSGYVVVDYEDDEDSYVDSHRIAPDVATALDWAGVRKVYALVDLSLFGDA